MDKSDCKLFSCKAKFTLKKKSQILCCLERCSEAFISVRFVIRNDQCLVAFVYLLLID